MIHHVTKFVDHMIYYMCYVHTDIYLGRDWYFKEELFEYIRETSIDIPDVLQIAFKQSRRTYVTTYIYIIQVYALVNNLGERQRNSKYGPEVFIDVVGDGRVPDITAEQQVKVCVYMCYYEI